MFGLLCTSHLMGLAFLAPLATWSEVSSVFVQGQHRWKAQNKEQKADSRRSILRKDSLWWMPLRRHCQEDFKIVLPSLVRCLFTNQREEETRGSQSAEDSTAGLEQNSCQQWESSLSFHIRELTFWRGKCYCLWFLVRMFVIDFCFVLLETGSWYFWLGWNRLCRPSQPWAHRDPLNSSHPRRG